MTLSIVSSNHVEALQNSLSKHISQYLLSDPFEAEVIVVPTFAMARWLNLTMAKQQGIAANIEYPQPASWIWQLAVTIVDAVPKTNPLLGDRVNWAIFEHLPRLIDSPEFEPIRHYLQQDTSGIKCWQLSVRIAEVFGRYQYYRPDMIKNWAQAEDKYASNPLPLDQQWQAKLWRALVEASSQVSWGGVVDQLLVSLKNGVNVGRLPQRVSLFALSNLPPIFIQLIHALAEHTAVTLYLHSPTDQYWADLKSQKSQLKLRLESPQQAEYYDSGNELLTTWGRQGQVLQDLLLDNEAMIANESDAYQPVLGDTLLQAIQRSIFELDDQLMTIEADDSLSVHVCHSPMRECQVLHDQMLRLLQRDAALDAEDILVMVPNISHYAPYIEAVFQADTNTPQSSLAWSLSDITLADEHPLVLTFLQLLKLPKSRFLVSDVLSLLDVDEINRRFGFDEQALEDIRYLLHSTQVRWAIDGQQKQQLGLPPTIENTWQQAKQRLFAGYAMAGNDYWEGIAAISQMQGESALNMGRFWHLFETLEVWRQRLSQPQTAKDWQNSLLNLLEDFFLVVDGDDDRLQHIRDVITELDHAHNTVISSELMLFWMEQQLASQEKPGRLFSGGITFCGMRPMRSLPFKVVCLLGMNDGDFPRHDSRVDFDLMHNHWRPADPLKGDEDRYLMLETLLCSRKSLYISYCGRSLKDNSECMPSVLVQELLDFIDTRFEAQGDAAVKMSDQITQQHPLQAFSELNFQQPMAGYSQYWCDIANLLKNPSHIQPVDDWSKTQLQQPVRHQQEMPEIQHLNLLQLTRFLTHPIQYFFQKRLKINLSQDGLIEDEEIFSLNGLEAWQLKQRICEDFLNNTETDLKRLSAEGLLPHGPAANSSMTSILESQQSLLLQLEPYNSITAETKTILIKSRCDKAKAQPQQNDRSKPIPRFNLDLELSGLVNSYYPGQGLMQFTSSKINGKHILSLWVHHLALCATEQMHSGEMSCLITQDKHLVFAPLDSESALQQLQFYVSLYQQGMQQPLAIFPAASHAFVKNWVKNKDDDKALKAAYVAWNGNSYGGKNSGDVHDAYIQLALRDNLQDPLCTEVFQVQAKLVYQLALSHGELS